MAAFDFQGVQPVVSTGRHLLMRSNEIAGTRFLVTAAGRRLPLRQLSSYEVLHARLQRQYLESFRQLVEAELTKSSAAYGDCLQVIVEQWLPQFRARDIGQAFVVEPERVREGSGCEMRSDSDIWDAIPKPIVPGPALWIGGRAWMLSEAQPRSGQTIVCLGGRVFRPNGKYWLVGTLEKRWGQDFRAAAIKFAVSCTPRAATTPSELLVEAQKAVLERGAFEHGDLVFLATNPPRLGCMIPPHYNHAIGAIRERELAIASPMRLPPSGAGGSELQVFRRSETGRWTRLQRSLCLGASGHFYIDDASALALWGRLRWAAERIATNGRFHERDGRTAQDEEYSYYYYQ